MASSTRRSARASGTKPSTSRKAIGDRAELAVADWFCARGIEIVGANVRVGRLEIDLLIRDGDAIAIVEVRTRGKGSWQRALASLDAKKIARLRAAGERLWRERFSSMPGIERIRFDAASVVFGDDGEVVVEHVKAAF